MKFVNNLELINLMKEMICEGCCLAKIFRIVLEKMGTPERQGALPLRSLLEEGFGLHFTEAYSIRGWLPDGTGEFDDARLNQIFLADIVKNKAKWLPEDKSDCWLAQLPELHLPEFGPEFGYQVRPYDISEETWLALSDSDRQNLSAVMVGCSETKYQRDVLSALAQRLQERIDSMDLEGRKD